MSIFISKTRVHGYECRTADTMGADEESQKVGGKKKVRTAYHNWGKGQVEVDRLTTAKGVVQKVIDQHGTPTGLDGDRYMTADELSDFVTELSKAEQAYQAEAQNFIDAFARVRQKGIDEITDQDLRERMDLQIPARPPSIAKFHVEQQTINVGDRFDMITNQDARAMAQKSYHQTETDFADRLMATMREEVETLRDQLLTPEEAGRNTRYRREQWLHTQRIFKKISRFATGITSDLKALDLFKEVDRLAQTITDPALAPTTAKDALNQILGITAPPPPPVPERTVGDKVEAILHQADNDRAQDEWDDMEDEHDPDQAESDRIDAELDESIAEHEAGDEEAEIYDEAGGYAHNPDEPTEVTEEDEDFDF